MVDDSYELVSKVLDGLDDEVMSVEEAIAELRGDSY